MGTRQIKWGVDETSTWSSYTSVLGPVAPSGRKRDGIRGSGEILQVVSPELFYLHHLLRGYVMKTLQATWQFVVRVFLYCVMILVCSVYTLLWVCLKAIEPMVEQLRPGSAWHRFGSVQSTPVLHVTVTAHGLGTELRSLRIQDFCNQASQEVFDRVVKCCLEQQITTPPQQPVPPVPPLQP
ncbi:MAG: hypothetical protein E6R03_13200 [Hyphomicrobiaceae bacterium]|nr:MAG: hypothetical protein E6R03_13200 [Hyphomicrobiaceae bacterium]